MAFTDRLHNRGSISTGYDIDNSLKFENGNSEAVYKGYSSTPTSKQRQTISWWVKFSDISPSSGGHQNFNFAAQSGGRVFAVHFINGQMTIYNDSHSDGNGSNYWYYNYSTQYFRDTAAWYHLVVAVDTTLSTASDRVKAYVNGERITSWGASVDPTQNSDLCTFRTNAETMSWGGAYGFANSYTKGYLTECYFIDGQQLAPTEFAETDEDTGIWKPKEYTGTFGNNGSFLDFESSGSLGTDQSGNGNNFNLYNITSVDQATDTPTNNFCLINTLQPADQTVTYGATIWSNTVANSWRSSVANTGVNNGKWYYEVTIDTGGYNMVGITGENGINTLLGTYLGASADATNASYGYLGNGVIYNNAGQPTTGLPTFGGGNIISIALDMDNGYLYFAKNGSWVNSGDPTSGSSGTGGWALYDSSETQFFASSIYGSSDSLKYNFGGFYYTTISTAETDANGYGNFEYAPPSGYYALCTKNLAEFG